VVQNGSPATAPSLSPSLGPSLGLGSYAAVFAPIDAAGRADAVTTRLGDAISLGVLPDGLPLPSEHELSEKLGVATVTVRMALGSLREAGLIRTRRGRGGGSFVRSPADGGRGALLSRLRDLGQGDLRDLGDHYAAVGGACAALAAERADHADLARLDALAVVDPGGSVASEWVRAEGGFHLEVAVAAQSARLVREEIGLQAEVGTVLWLAHAHTGSGTRVAEAHRRISSAVRAGRGPEARAALEDHAHDLVTALRPLHLEARGFR
jgi:GntR family transcriptional repressor for pyruvate dehydrogenase complex